MPRTIEKVTTFVTRQSKNGYEIAYDGLAIWTG